MLYRSGGAGNTAWASVFLSYWSLDGGGDGGKHLVPLTLVCSTMLIGSIWENWLVSPAESCNCWAGLGSELQG